MPPSNALSFRLTISFSFFRYYYQFQDLSTSWFPTDTFQPPQTVMVGFSFFFFSPLFPLLMFYHFSHCIGFHFISPSITFTCPCFFSVLGAYLWLGTPHLQLFSTPPVFKVGLLSSVSASLKIHMIFHNEERVERRRTD